MPDCLFLSHPQPRDSGDYRHRVTLPGAALSRHLEVAEMQTSHPTWLSHGLQVGLLVVKMVADPTVLSLMEARRALGRPCAFEISDDFRDFPSSLPGAAFYRDPRHQALIEEAARQADLLQFSSHGLAAKYGHLNPQHLVFPNQLTDVPALQDPPPSRSSRPVLGWSGSAGHLDDARQLVAWLRPWYAARRQRGQFLPSLRVMAADQVASVFLTAGLPVHVQAPGSFEAYLDFLQELDIGLAILGDTDFARGRSDGKFLEYASRGVVCLATASGEYLHGVRDGETGLLFEGPQQLAAHLTAVVDDGSLRTRLREAAHAHVSRERTHHLAALQRARAYGRLLGRELPATSTNSPLPSEPVSELVSLCDPTEPRFLEATMQHMRGLVHEALDGYLAVVSAHPGFHEAWARSALIARGMGAQRDAELFEGMASQALRTQLQPEPQACALPA